MRRKILHIELLQGSESHVGNIQAFIGKKMSFLKYRNNDILTKKQSPNIIGIVLFCLIKGQNRL